MLSFRSREAEKAFQLQRNRQLMGQDVSWALFWTFMAGGGLMKWVRAEGPKDNWELAWILPYVMCCPTLLLVIKLWPAWYVRYRVPAIMVMRLARTFLSLARVHIWEAVYLGASYGSIPNTFLGTYAHLSWRPSSHIAAALAFVTPLHTYLPFLLVYLALLLWSTGQRCLAECPLAFCGAGGNATTAAALAGGAGAGAANAAAAGLQQAMELPGSCQLANGPAAEQYYSGIVAWIRRAVPFARFVPGSWRLGSAGSCLRSCYAVHSWLQATVGVLMPLLLLWGWEERLRCRELKSRRLQLEQQRERKVEQEHDPSSSWSAQEQELNFSQLQWQQEEEQEQHLSPPMHLQQQLKPSHPQMEQAREDRAAWQEQRLKRRAGRRSSSSPLRRWLESVAVPEPLPAATMVSGWVLASWGVWLMLEVTILR